MNKVKYYILLLFSLAHFSSEAQEHMPYINHNYEVIFKTLNPLIQSSNPGAIYFNPSDSIGQASLSYSLSDGGYKRAMDSKQDNALQLFTEHYRKFNNTLFWGQFNFSKGWSKESQFSNLYNPYKGTPYLLVDTIGGDNISKEEYQLAAKIAQPVGINSILSAAIEYKVGLAAQDRDPRALNKVVSLNTTIGVLKQLQDATLGLDLHYKHNNEDIDINVIKEDTAHFIYALSGLGSYSKRNQSSFYRLYSENSFGGHLLYETNGNIINLGFQLTDQIVKDGHKEGIATWSGIKTDSRFSTQCIDIKDIYTYRNGDQIHQFVISAKQDNYIGTEVLQTLEFVDNSNVQQWTTFSEDDKYKKNIYNASLEYTFSKFPTELLRDYSFGFKLGYHDYQEEYLPHDNMIHIANINYHCQGSKLIKLKNGHLEGEVSIDYQQNVTSNSGLNYTSEITDLIISPDLHYATSNRLMESINLSYLTITTNKKQLSVKASYAFKHTKDTYFTKGNRHFTSLALGLMF